MLFGKKDIFELSTKEALSLEGILPTFISSEINLINLLILIKASSSKREAREFINNKAIEVNGKKITDINYLIKKDAFNGKATIIRKGKKNFFLIKH